MTRRLLLGLRIAGAVVALALAAVLAVFAGDVLAASATMKRDDLRYRISPDARGLWKVEGRTGSLASILKLKDDLAIRQAAQRFVLSRRRANIAYDPTRIASRGEAQAALAEAEAQELSPEQASPLANYSAILAYQEAVGDPENGPELLRRSTAEFRRAIRIDPANAEAKFNLELLLRLLDPSQQQRRDRLGLGTGGEQAAGAAAAGEGAGY